MLYSKARVAQRIFSIILGVSRESYFKDTVKVSIEKNDKLINIDR